VTGHRTDEVLYYLRQLSHEYEVESEVERERRKRKEDVEREREREKERKGKKISDSPLSYGEVIQGLAWSSGMGLDYGQIER